MSENPNVHLCYPEALSVSHFFSLQSTVLSYMDNCHIYMYIDLHACMRGYFHVSACERCV